MFLAPLGHIYASSETTVRIPASCYTYTTVRSPLSLSLTNVLFCCCSNLTLKLYILCEVYTVYTLSEGQLPVYIIIIIIHYIQASLSRLDSEE